MKEIKGYIHKQKTPVLIELLKNKLNDLEVERNKIVRLFHISLELRFPERE